VDASQAAGYEMIMRLLLLALLEIPFEVWGARLKSLKARGDGIRFEAAAEREFLIGLEKADLIMEQCRRPVPPGKKRDELIVLTLRTAIEQILGQTVRPATPTAASIRPAPRGKAA
jgi:hypothetical protein